MIKTYKKGKIKYFPLPDLKQEIRNPKKNKSPKYNYKKVAFFILPALSFSAGLTILFFQIFPTIKFYIEERYSNKYVEIISPVPEKELTAQEFEMEGNFEAQYFANILTQQQRSI